MVFINETGLTMDVVTGMTNNITGNLFFTFLLILVLLFVIGLIFRMPLQILVLFLIPYALLLASQDAFFYPIVGIMLLFIAVSIIFSTFTKS